MRRRSNESFIAHPGNSVNVPLPPKLAAVWVTHDAFPPFHMKLTITVLVAICPSA